MTRSEEVRRPPSPRQTNGKAAGTAKATPPRRASNGATTSTARKPAAKKQPARNVSTGEQPIVKPERVIVDIEGPTWAETMASLAAPEELDSDDIAILTGWTPTTTVPASDLVEAPAANDVPEAVAPSPADVIEAPAAVEEPIVADHVAPESPAIEPTAEPIVEPLPLVGEPATDAVPAVTTGFVTEVAPVAVDADAAMVGTNPARAFTLWRRRRPRVRKVTRVVRRIDTWSVLKVSVLFYLVLFVILLVASVLLWNLAESTGTVTNIEGFIRDLFNLETFDVSGPELFRASWTLGVFLVIAGTGLNVTMAVLFNLISDLVGGVRVIVLEEEVVLASRRASVTGRPATMNIPASTDVVPEPVVLAPVESVDEA